MCLPLLLIQRQQLLQLHQAAVCLQPLVPAGGPVYAALQCACEQLVHLQHILLHGPEPVQVPAAVAAAAAGLNVEADAIAIVAANPAPVAGAACCVHQHTQVHAADDQLEVAAVAVLGPDEVMNMHPSGQAFLGQNNPAAAAVAAESPLPTWQQHSQHAGNCLCWETDYQHCALRCHRPLTTPAAVAAAIYVECCRLVAEVHPAAGTPAVEPGALVPAAAATGCLAYAAVALACMAASPTLLYLSVTS